MFTMISGGKSVLPVVVFVVIVGLVIFAIMTALRVWRLGSNPSRDLGSAQQPPGQADPAFVELRARFARGEIDEDEYSHKARLLGYPLPVTQDEQSSPESI